MGVGAVIDTSLLIMGALVSVGVALMALADLGKDEAKDGAAGAALALLLFGFVGIACAVGALAVAGNAIFG
jgi:hypothetical protein